MRDFTTGHLLLAIFLGAILGSIVGWAFHRDFWTCRCRVCAADYPTPEIYICPKCLKDANASGNAAKIEREGK
jgi:hypothetical protein